MRERVYCVHAERPQRCATHDAPVGPDGLAADAGSESGTRPLIIGRMLEWKPPDPRIVHLVRRIQNAARRRFRHDPGSPKSFAAIDEELAIDRVSKHWVREPTVPGADLPDHQSDG